MWFTAACTAEELSQRSAIAALVRGYPSDPDPNLVFVDAVLQSSAIRGFSTGAIDQVASGSLADARRVLPSVRIGASVSIGYATAANELASVRTLASSSR